jgi:hypothetical protein
MSEILDQLTTEHVNEVSLQRFQAKFACILNSLQNKDDEEESFAVLNSLEHLILSDLLNLKEQKMFMNSSENQSLIERSRRLNAFVDSCIERTFSHAMIHERLNDHFMCANNPLFHPYLERFDALAREETTLLKASSNDKILFIGGGAFPITAIHYVKKTGCQLHCVEKLPERAHIARQVVSSMGMDEDIKILVAEGQKVDCSIYDAIVVGVLAIPKREIIGQIIHTAKKDVRVICRTTIGVRGALCAPLNEDDCLSLQEIQRAIATKNQTLTSILFRK